MEADYSASADGLSSVKRGYDPDNNMVSVIESVGGKTFTTSQNWDHFDRLAQRTDPYGASLTYGYNALQISH